MKELVTIKQVLYQYYISTIKKELPENFKKAWTTRCDKSFRLYFHWGMLFNVQ